MIDRYSHKGMAQIWSEKTKYEVWLEVETMALEGMVKAGLVPAEALKDLSDKGSYDIKRTLEIEKEVRHDVIAFLTNLAENMGPNSRYLHWGMTSSDLVDTAFAVRLKRSSDIILKELNQLIDIIRRRAEEYKYTPCIGRSHGIHAEPTTFGLKMISWFAELCRQKERLEHSSRDVAVGQISGAVGTYASVRPEVEEYVMEKLGLLPETVSSQVVHRDRHAAFFNALAILATSIEKFSVEIRHLQRTEVREVEEGFSAGQKGSSAMPHKRNPILCENLSGLARVVRGYAASAMENVPLWHERDISHSSVERIIAPDACILTAFMLKRFSSVMEKLVVHQERMASNLQMTRGLVFSGTVLLRLVDAGMLREKAYQVVQKHALAAWEGGEPLKERLINDREIGGVLSREELEDAFDVRKHFESVDYIFNRAEALSRN